MQTQRPFSLLLLVAFIGLYLACSNPSRIDEAASASPTSNPAASPATVAATTAELEPVMPEKVQVAFEQNCKSCHGPDGHGITGVAPDIRRAPRRNLKEWVAYLNDQKGVHSQTKIPAMASLIEKDYEALGGYLADLTQNNPATTNSSK
jgi:mono/diheme cytochrome c family protein